MYARTLPEKNQTVTLAVSGKLWNRSLVMIDKETGSLWSHLLGQAMDGPLEGESLEMIPSSLTDWKTWKQKHPKTSAVNLSRTSREFKRDFYKDPSRFVLGYVENGNARAWPYNALVKKPLVNDTFENRRLLVTFDKETGAGYLFDRTVDEEELTFQAIDGVMTDTNTGSEWDPATGKSTAGELKGRQLTVLPAIPSFRKAWFTFHPESTVWRRSAE